MSGALNTGDGRCQGTACLLISPVQAVVELGASGDVREKALNAVHHANRHGDPADFIAAALPKMCRGRNCMFPGHDIELIGSERCLADFLELDSLKALARRGMLKPLEIQETFHEPGEIGAAYVRDRACEKNTDGWLRRNKARAERRGKTWHAGSAKVRGNDLTALALRYGKAVLHVRQIVAEMTEEPLIVSTYGFSGTHKHGPAVLPVFPDAAREESNEV